MQSKTPKFIKIQQDFAAHLKNPRKNPAPEGIENRRMEIYRSLFYNNIESFISGGFPVLRRLMSDKDWHEMVRDFFANHLSKTPFFLEISQEFLLYLSEEGRQRAESLFPFCLELAHYEWAELALGVLDETIEWEQIETEADLFDTQPFVSPFAWNLTYHYPVHRISPDYCPEKPPEQPTHLVVYRDAEDEVKFLEVNGLTAILLTLLQQETPLSGAEALLQVAKEGGFPEPEQILVSGKTLLSDLKARGILLGGRKKAK